MKSLFPGRDVENGTFTTITYSQHTENDMSKWSELVSISLCVCVCLQTQSLPTCTTIIQNPPTDNAGREETLESKLHWYLKFTCTLYYLMALKL